MPTLNLDSAYLLDILYRKAGVIFLYPVFLECYLWLLETSMFPFLPPPRDRELACSIASVMSDSVTPWTVDHQAPLSMGILWARILEWVAMRSSRGSSQARDQTRDQCSVSRIGRQILYHQATREAPT